MHVVPEAVDGLRHVVLVRERRKACRAEQEKAPPAGGNPSQRAPMTRRM
jgi:hypothetical protein